ncbi:MAG TPA: DUF1080 domain-containing protein [Bacteroidales bacterium]|nr:DUF1080 domain-containing protein [Bacteroidales bacterium]
MRKYVLISFYIFLFLGLMSCASTKKPEWKYLFNGKDLSGWVQRNGKASFEVNDSVIVGTTVLNTPNSFLCTENKYGDFILELEFKVAPDMNSGVQIRSESTPEYLNGRVHGYQVEIDPSDRAFTGGIYDEARRGWLYPLNDPEDAEARGAFKNGQWNKFRVEAIGNNIRTWVNGVPVTNLYDEMTPEGFIALQVHSVGKDSSRVGEQIMWKNIRILTGNLDEYAQESPARVKSYLVNTLTDREKAEGWKLLFDGKTSNGWRRAYHDSFPEKGWRIADGEITVLPSNGAESENGGDIVTTDQYADFELQAQVKITKGANSGIKYFVTEQEDGNTGSAIGLEYQVLDDANHPDAKLGNHEGSRTMASLYDLIKAQNKRPNAIGRWNNVRIISNGHHVEHWLNGFKVLEYERGSDHFKKLVSESKYAKWPNFGEAEKGHILLQDHGNEVSYRSIKLKILD